MREAWCTGKVPAPAILLHEAKRRSWGAELPREGNRRFGFFDAVESMRTARNRGNVYVEYFVLAMIVALATIAFWQGGFGRTRITMEAVFDDSVNRILAP